jgi:hypothetical protein
MVGWLQPAQLSLALAKGDAEQLEVKTIYKYKSLIKQAIREAVLRSQATPVSLPALIESKRNRGYRVRSDRLHVTAQRSSR